MSCPHLDTVRQVNHESAIAPIQGGLFCLLFNRSYLSNEGTLETCPAQSDCTDKIEFKPFLSTLLTSVN